MIQVSWQKGVSEWIDEDLRVNARTVAERIAYFVLLLEKKIDLSNIEFIGHGIGAHVAGFGTKNFYNANDKK